HAAPLVEGRGADDVAPAAGAGSEAEAEGAADERTGVGEGEVGSLEHGGERDREEVGGEGRGLVVAPHHPEAVAPVELLDERVGGPPGHAPLVSGGRVGVVPAAPAETGQAPVEVDVLPEREAALVPGPSRGVVGGGVVEG